MKEQTLEPREFREAAEVCHIEPDWAEAEWFQVWLELARLPHKTADLELALNEPETSSLAPAEVSVF